MTGTGLRHGAGDRISRGGMLALSKSRVESRL